MFFYSLFLLALLTSTQGRAVNISNTWVLPEEGYPVFYRYFRDRISWYEADAVCQFHHANLVTVDTTPQYDAVRAYLKELDISSAVWVGLIRNNLEGDFTWTDYRGLSGDGYWSSAPDARAAPLCAAADPSLDYRWEARPCGGPTIASFICELPVPQWALGNEGCMVQELPALTILYLPESAAVQLTADCGLARVKKVQCTGNMKRENLLKDLSCTYEEETSTTMYPVNFTWTDTASSDHYTTDSSTEDTAVTEENIQFRTSSSIAPSVKQNKMETDLNLRASLINFKPLELKHEINLNTTHISNNNLLIDINIPAISQDEKVLFNGETKKLDDDKSVKHKMLHEEFARLENVENLFLQSTDHFIPPLVIAKAKQNNDMTEMSLEQKQKQHFAEENKTIKSQVNYTENGETTINFYKDVNTTTETTTIRLEKNRLKKEKNKSISPKKYISNNEDLKSKNTDKTNFKLKLEKPLNMEKFVPVEINKEFVVTTTASPEFNISKDNTNHMTIDLTVIIKEPGSNTEQETFYSNYSGDISDLENIKNEPKVTNLNDESKLSNISLHERINYDKTEKETVTSSTVAYENNSTKETIDTDTSSKESSSTSYFTTEMVKDKNNSHVVTAFPIIHNQPKNLSDIHRISVSNYGNVSATDNYSATSLRTHEIYQTTTNTPYSNQSLDNYSVIFNSTTTTNSREENKNLIQTNMKKIYDSASTVLSITVEDTAQEVNNTELHNKNISAMEFEVDEKSPLLSGVNEPVPRPNRSRKLQQQKKIKFNPFRILG